MESIKNSQNMNQKYIAPLRASTIFDQYITATQMYTLITTQLRKQLHNLTVHQITNCGNHQRFEREYTANVLVPIYQPRLSIYM